MSHHRAAGPATTLPPQNHSHQPPQPHQTHGRSSHGQPQHQPHGPADEPGAKAPWTVLGLMLAAQFMVVLDVSVVNVALPSIGADLHFSSSRLPVGRSAPTSCSAAACCCSAAGSPTSSTAAGCSSSG